MAYIVTYMGFHCLRVVRLTSPNLNYLIIVGSIIMYTTIIIRLIPSTDETVNYVICNVRPQMQLSQVVRVHVTVFI